MKALFKKNYKGFTLIELMIVMAIISVIATLLVAAITAARRMSIETTHRANAKTMHTMMEVFYANNKRFPNDVGNYSFEKISKLGYTELPDNIAIGKGGCDDRNPLHVVGGGGWIEFPAAGSNIIKIKAYDYQCGSPIQEIILSK